MKTKKFTYSYTSKSFGDAIEELLEKARKLAEKEAKGFTYQKIWVKPTTVRKHRRKGHFMLRPVRGKRG